MRPATSVFGDLDGLGVALALHRLGREQRLDEPQLFDADGLRLRTRDERVVSTGCRAPCPPREAVGLLVHEVLELVGGGRELLRGLLALEIGLDLRAHLLERLRMRLGPVTLIT